MPPSGSNTPSRPRATQNVVPTAGQTIVATTGKSYLMMVLKPAALLATLTITMPSNPNDGDVVSIVSTQIVTTLTVNGGTLNVALTSLAANALPISKTFCSADSTWY